ncbi:MAG: TIGR03915 family putative DNA repair protein, partial [Treponema sp.]|nr:TIGR03915 family putative DNA repair protein [Treponema sp.]
RMSELPIEAEISRFIVKVWEAAAGTINGGSANGRTPEARAAAEKAASDRGDPDVLVVQKAAYKVQHEIHRLEGFLRFNPDSCGVYIARCAPDHFTLPALAEHFFLRFGETPWVIIDEKRKLCLYRKRDCQPILIPSDSAFISAPEPNAADDPWENLWRLYHRSVNNESRKNVKLQRQFMPERYRKYLSELK